MSFTPAQANIERWQRIEAAAQKVADEIRESKKLGQFISTHWIQLQLDDALKPVKP